MTTTDTFSSHSESFVHPIIYYLFNDSVLSLMDKTFTYTISIGEPKIVDFSQMNKNQ